MNFPIILKITPNLSGDWLTDAHFWFVRLALLMI